MEGEFMAEDYNLHKVGDLYNVGDMIHVNFENKIKARYVRRSTDRSSLMHRCGIFKRKSGFLCQSGRKNTGYKCFDKRPGSKQLKSDYQKCFRSGI